MKLRLCILAALCAGLFTAAPPALADESGGSGTHAAHYYVALGDSLAEGFQPNGDLTHGYADQLAVALKADDPTLRLENLACGGETTSSMISGVQPHGLGARYFCVPPGPRREQLAHGSQLADAVAFLHAHTQSVSLITIDIGGNDVGLCIFQLDRVCLTDALTQVQQNLPVILSTLRDAAGPNVPIVGMNYYDPFLAFWFSDPTAAQTTQQMIGQVNAVLASMYDAAGDPVADVETAFSTTDWTLVDGLPLNVARICQWTWMCDPTRGPDVHANSAGHGVIAQAFEQALP